MMCMMWGHTDRPDFSQGKFPFDQLAVEGVGDFCCLAYHGFWCFSEGRLQCLDVGEIWGLEGKNAVIFIEPNVDIKLASSVDEDKQNKHNLIPKYSQYQYHPKNHWLCRWYVFSFNGLWLEIFFGWFILIHSAGKSEYSTVWIAKPLFSRYFGSPKKNYEKTKFWVDIQKSSPWKKQVLSGHIIPWFVHHVEFLMVEAYIAVCVLWTFFCSLSRSSPRHGYTVTVAPWSW